MRRSIGRLLAISAKEVRHISRDFRMLALALVMPLMMIVLFGYGITFDVEELTVGVADADRTPASRRLVQGFKGTTVFKVKRELTDPSEVDRLFRNGTIRVGLVIEKGYGANLKKGHVARAQLLLDGSDNTTAQLAVGYAAGVAQNESRSQLRASGLLGEPPLQARVKVRFNPEMKSTLFIVPGLFAMVLATLSVLLTALSVSREWERGSMEQLFATPVRRIEVILGKLLPYLVLGIVQVLLLLALATWLFDVPIRGSIWLVGGVSLLFLAGMLAQGLLLAVVTKNQQVATQAAVVSTMLPAMLLSGFMFPIENMPAVLQGIASIIPARYFIDAMRTILLKGGGLAEVWHDVVALLIVSVVLTTIVTLRFKRRIA